MIQQFNAPVQQVAARDIYNITYHFHGVGVWLLLSPSINNTTTPKPDSHQKQVVE